MHFEILIEDCSGRRLLEYVVPKIIGPQGGPHTWRLHAYRGMGRIPAHLSPTSDPSKRILLDQLPRLLRGYVRTPGIGAVVVVLDADDRDCADFLAELTSLAASCDASHLTLFRLAIEEVEAWYLGDRPALMRAYPRTKVRVLDNYIQDSVCGTWELLAEATHSGGLQTIRQAGGPLAGQVKHEWAERMGPMLDPSTNVSPSFGKFCDGIRRLAGISSSGHLAPPNTSLPFDR